MRKYHVCVSAEGVEYGMSYLSDDEAMWWAIYTLDPFQYC